MKSRLANSLATWPLWRIDAVGAAVVCLMAGVWFFGGLRPLSEARAARQGLEAELATQKDIAGRKADVVAGQDRSLQTMRVQIEASAIRLRQADRVNQQVSDLAAAAAGAGLRVDEIKPTAAVPLSRFTMVPIRLSGAGGYRPVTAFLGKLRTDFRDTGVTGFQLRRNDTSESGELRFELNLVWYAAPTVAPVKK